VQFYETPISDAGLAQLKEIPAIKEVALIRNTLLTDQCLQSLIGMPGLEKLGIYGLKLTDAAYTGLSGMKGLKDLNFSEMPVGDSTLENVKGLSNLQYLGIDGADNVSSAGIAHLKALKLKRLALDSFKQDTKLNAAALKEVGDLATLEELRVGVILPVARSQRVPWVDDTGVAHLGRLKNLKRLNLGSCAKVSDAGFASLKGLTQMEELNLAYTTVTDAGLSTLKGFANLRQLNLDGLKLTEKGLAHLTGLTKLESLSSREAGAGVTDAAIQQLKGLSALKTLDLSHTAVTEKGAVELKKALPMLNVDIK